MRVAFRADSSIQIGTGHIMRCLTLADALREEDVEVCFITRDLVGNINALIENKGFGLFQLEKIDESKKTMEYSNSDSDKSSTGYEHWLGVTLQEDIKQTQNVLLQNHIDWLIVDHYAIDCRWQREIKPLVKNIMVIDDLANRKHLCDLLLDQTYGRNEEDYKELLPKDAELLVGSEFSLLRPEFSAWREYSLKRRSEPKLEKILVNLGGVDKDNITCEVLRALQDISLPKSIFVDVVMGANAPWKEEVKRLSKTLPFESSVHIDVKNMAELMANSDLAIGAAGATTWERCCLGLPSLAIVIADNQEYSAGILGKVGATILIRKTNNFAEDIKQNLYRLARNSSLLKQISEQASTVTNGLGVYKVVKRLTEYKGDKYV